MSMRYVFLTAALVAISISGSGAIAQPSSQNDNSVTILAQNTNTGQRRIRSNKLNNQGQFIEALDLNDSQKQQLAQIRQKYQGQMEPVREQLMATRQELKSLLSGTASTNEIRNKHQQIITLQQKMGQMRFDSMLEMREVLTPEQRAKFAQLMEQRQGRFRDRLNQDNDDN